MKRKILYIVLPLVFILIGVFFAIYYNIPRVTYVYNSKYNGYLVSEVYGNSSYYKIQSQYLDKDVVGIDSRAFMGKSNLETIEFEDSSKIIYLGRLCFSDCKNLKNIDISSVNLIDKNAFYNCISLKEITINASVINGGAFFGCEGLTKVTLTDKVTSIGSYAFGACKELKELTIPQKVYLIGDGCFVDSGIEKLYVPMIFNVDDYVSKLNYVIYY